MWHDVLRPLKISTQFDAVGIGPKEVTCNVPRDISTRMWLIIYKAHKVEIIELSNNRRMIK